MRRLLALVLTLLMVFPAMAEEQAGYSRGDVVADFALTTWDGQELLFSQLLAEKEAVVLHIFTLRCGACEVEMPLLQSIYEAYGDRLAFIAVTIDEVDTDKQLKTYCTRRKLTFPVARDTADLALQYPISCVPSTFLIDKEGVLQERKAGAFQDAEEFAAFVAPYLVAEAVVEEQE